ncbi:hypothetical protein GCM10009795_021820 [Nocardioides hankookensis]
MPRRQVRIALDAGLAGEPVRTRAATLYEAARVAELAARPLVAMGAVYRACPYGLLVDRRVTLGGSAVGSSVEEVSDVDLGLWRAFDIAASIRHHGPFPYVATICGFVVRGGDIVEVRHIRDTVYALAVDEPGAWFDQWRGRRWPTGPGRQWLVLGR